MMMYKGTVMNDLRLSRPASRILGLLITVSGFMFQPWSLAQGQTVLDSLYVSAASVNVSSGYQLDTLRARLANTTTGISYTSFFLGNPDLGQDVSGTPGTLISGSANDGVWEGTLFIEANTPPGTYPVFVQTFDASFNETLLQSGKTVQITGGDTVPPSLAGTDDVAYKRRRVRQRTNGDRRY